MQITIEQHAGGNNKNKKGLEAIQEESKFEEEDESNDEIERLDSREMMQKMDDVRESTNPFSQDREEESSDDFEQLSSDDEFGGDDRMDVTYSINPM